MSMDYYRGHVVGLESVLWFIEQHPDATTEEVRRFAEQRRRDSEGILAGIRKGAA